MSRRQRRRVDDQEILVELVERGWELVDDPKRDGDRRLVTHPRLRWPWPIRDALRLEEERSGGEVCARRLLGRVRAS